MLFADDREPVWARSRALPSETMLTTLVNVIRGLPRGAYTGLKKQGDSRFEVRNGYSAAELAQRGQDALVAFGEAAIPTLQRAASETFPYSKVISGALARLRA